MPPDVDWQLRLAAFARLEEVKRVCGGILTDDDLDAGFTFNGETIKFWSSRRGIWRLKQLSSSGEALSRTNNATEPRWGNSQCATGGDKLRGYDEPTRPSSGLRDR